MANDKLTNKQEGFSQDIASGRFDYDWLSYEANYNCKGMSQNAIYVETCRLLQNPKVALRVAELRQGTVKRNEVTINKVLEQLANWLLFDPLDITDEKTDCVKRLADMDKRARMSLSEIHVQELWEMIPLESNPKVKIKTKVGELKKIKFIDKRAVSDQFMKKFGAYTNQENDLSSNLDAIKDLIETIRK